MTSRSRLAHVGLHPVWRGIVAGLPPRGQSTHTAELAPQTTPEHARSPDACARPAVPRAARTRPGATDSSEALTGACLAAIDPRQRPERLDLGRRRRRPRRRGRARTNAAAKAGHWAASTACRSPSPTTIDVAGMPTSARPARQPGPHRARGRLRGGSAARRRRGVARQDPRSTKPPSAARRPQRRTTATSATRATPAPPGGGSSGGAATAVAAGHAVAALGCRHARRRAHPGRVLRPGRR